MLHYIETTGRSEDAAIAAALEQLGMERDEVSVEILERAKTGFLGIGSTPAKVRVTYEGPDMEIPTRKEPSKEKPAPKAKEAPRAKEPRAPKEAAAPKIPVSAPKAPAAPLAGEEGEKAEQIAQFLSGLMAHMGVAATPAVTISEREIYEVDLVGEDLGGIIGRRGETLDAIQQITGYAVNRGAHKRVRIHVDAENYRAKREEALCKLAERVAGKVVKYRKDVTLEAMNAYERHVIHTALQDVSGVTTQSTGVEPNRRTVVCYAPEKK